MFRISYPDIAGRAPMESKEPAGRDEDGIMALELAILVPFVVLMLLGIVALGRVTHGRQLVDEAAATGSRAAALASSPGQAEQEARSAVIATLADAGVSCRSNQIDVDTSALAPGGQVVVEIRCRSDLSELAAAGVPGQVMLTARSSTPIETYRDFSGAP